MVAKCIAFLCVVAVAAAGIVPAVPVAKVAYAEPEAPAQYDFNYSVQDTHTGDVKEQQESRAGDAVHGSYSLIQPDGVRRIVEYTSDHAQGFNAIVRYEGHPVAAPAPVAKVAYAAPVARLSYAPAAVSYAAPATRLSYAGPAARLSYAPAAVSYAAPAARLSYAPAAVSYAAPVASVSYSSPVISYQH